MMDGNTFKVANAFAMHYRRVTGERLVIANMESADYAKPLLGKALASGDEELIAATRELKKVLKFVEGAPAMPGGVAVKDWERMEAAASKVGGPIGAMLVNQIKEQSPGSMEEAIKQVAEKLGGFGTAFLKEMGK